MSFTTSSIDVNAERVRHRIDHLAKLTDPARPFTRRAFTEPYRQARAWLSREFAAAGLDAHIDDGANLVGSRLGSVPELPAFLIGSHIDTVVGGGRFDGVAGVIAALEVAQSLHERGVGLRHSLKIIDFLSEEPSDFGASCVGSRAMIGSLSSQMLAATNPTGETLAAAIQRMGGNPRSLSGPLVGKGDIAAYLELHIEQGPVLEREQTTIGLVEGIVAIHRLAIRVRGQAAHAGTMPMNLRRDALVGASHIVQDVSLRAKKLSETESFVATIGRFNVEPNGINVVPGQVNFVVEARSLDAEKAAAFLETTRRTALTLAPALEVQVTELSASPAARSDASLLDALKAGCQSRGHRYRYLTSGAGHDAMHIASVAPMAMLFIACVDGVSHHSAESAAIEDVVAGTEVILDAILELDSSA